MELKLDISQMEQDHIPEGWRARTLSDLCLLQRGFDITSSQREPGSVPVYSSSGIAYYHNAAKVQPPGVITGRKGLLGDVYFADTAFWPHDTTLWVTDFRGNCPEYVYWYLSALRLERFNAATSVPTLNRNSIAALPITIPPLVEQRAIATALSDVDNLIDLLDKLIDKKRSIKTAAMQQLLTGKTRLPGFSGSWQVSKLGDIASIQIGRTPSRRDQSFWGRGNPWLSIADLNAKIVSSTREEITDKAAADMTVIPEGTLVMSFKLSIGRMAFTGREMYSNEAICSFLELAADPQYLYYALVRTDFSSYGKQAVKGYTLNSDSLRRVEILYPPLPEQSAIATVLSDMDAEIEALTSRRDKTKQIKRGMMQELLTGKTRLVQLVAA